MRCGQEMCPYWGGDGNVCLCALFDLDPPESTSDEDTDE